MQARLEQDDFIDFFNEERFLKILNLGKFNKLPKNENFVRVQHPAGQNFVLS